jgi:predicted PurR-regulated permease PerM
MDDKRTMENPDSSREARRGHPALAISDPVPGTEASRVWRTAAQAATIGIFIILFIAALNLARPVLLPAVSAFVVTMMLGPLSGKADRLGIPALVTAIVLWLLVIVLFYGLLTLLAAPAVDWISKVPDIGNSIQEKLHVLDGPISALQSVRNALLPGGSKDGVGFDIMSFVQPVVSIVAPGVGQMLIFFGTLFFMLLGRNEMRRVLVAFFDRREAKLRALKIMNDIEHNLTGYLSIVSVINICVGIASGIIAWLTGMPDPLAWAVLGFVLNYIAYIGAIIMEVSLFLVGLVAFSTLTHALIPPLLYFAVATLEGHFVTPSLVGHKLTLNPLAVFLSLVFWTWLWGPVGAFLSAPLLIMGMVAVSHIFPKEEPELPD